MLSFMLRIYGWKKQQQQHIDTKNLIRIRTDKWKLTTSPLYNVQYVFIYILCVAEWETLFSIYASVVWNQFELSLELPYLCLSVLSTFCKMGIADEPPDLRTPYGIAHRTGSTQYMNVHALKNMKSAFALTQFAF